MRILLVEDDEILSDVLVQTLTGQRYVVDAVEDGELGWEYASNTNYDLILLDVGLPSLNGISLCQRLRNEGCSTPILLMTAKDASEERIRGLDAGADDYVIKPLNLDELQARVRALLRRGEVSPTPVLEMGDLRLDPVTCEVTYNRQPLKLTPKEYSLLELFLRNPSRVFSRGQIVEHLWTFDDPPLEDSVKAHIKGLRRKLKTAGAADYIENVYGLGYRLNTNAARPAATKPKVASDGAAGVVVETKPSSSVEQTFHQAMGALWQQYQGLMIERLEALQNAADAIQAGTLSEDLRQSASQAAHKLAGVLGMFEREDGTQLARTIEHTLSDPRQITQDSAVPALVQQLDRLLDLPKAKPSPSVEPSQLLLITAESGLAADLEQLASPVELTWQRFETLAPAQAWLQGHSPDLVVLDVDETQWEKGLSLLSELTARTPPVPAIALTTADSLVDRVAIARAGSQGILVKPITAVQVWETVTQLLQRTYASAAKVLVVDDDPIVLAALRPMLEPWGIRMTGVTDPQRFWEVLNATAPDLLILDVEMPQFSGIELCQAVRTDPHWQELPILFLTAHRDAETVQQVFAAGADDYVTKPIVGPELLTRITNRLERTRLLQTLSVKDPLTGLTNQPQSSRELQHLIQTAEQHQTPFSLAVVTLTNLRQVNLQYGHDTGNQVLQRWGQLLHSAFHGREVLGYWGNGEFVIGIPESSLTEARDRLSALMTTLRQQIFTAADGDRFQVNSHFALAEYLTDGATLQSLYRVAGQGVGE